MAKGHKTGGRRKGTPNRITGTVRENVIEVFERVGGVSSMATWAQENRTDFYRLYARLIPTEIHADVGAVSLIQLLSSLPKDSDEEHMVEDSRPARVIDSTCSTIDGADKLTAITEDFTGS